jgi:hypothetical protein
MGGGHCCALPGGAWSRGQQGAFAYGGHARRECDAGCRLGRRGGDERCQADESSGDRVVERDPSWSEYGAGQLHSGCTDGCDVVRADGMGSGHICAMPNRPWCSRQSAPGIDGWHSAGHCDCEPFDRCGHGESGRYGESSGDRICEHDTAGIRLGPDFIHCFLEGRTLCL